MNEIEEILKKAKEDGIDEDIVRYIEEIDLDNQRLERENAKLANGTSPSILQKYRESNKNIRQKNKELNEQIKKLQRKKSSQLAHLSKDAIGVYERMLDDFERMNGSKEISFPGRKHPIFIRFNELANKYPNREFIVHELKKKVNEKIALTDFEIKTQQKNIQIWEECDKIANENPDTWEEDVDEKMANLYRVTTIDQIESEIEKLEKDKETIRKWNMLKENILPKPQSDIEIKNNLYYDIFNEFDRIYNFCHYVGNVAQYKANIRVEGFSKEDIRSALTRELEKQIGLCEEPNTHNFFYSNGEGRLVPYELNRELLKYINENTTFVQYGKTTKYKSGNIINSKTLFEEVPLYCNKVQYRNPNLVGFNNCFYDIVDGKIINLNSKAPVLPLKNTKTELYLNKDSEKNIKKEEKKDGEVIIDDTNVVPIEDNAMKDIFMNCFTQQDRKTLLAYIGCALYDKGYTQRQESLFIMGKGGTGKGLNINEFLPTPTGWVQMKDIQVGDKLFDEQGNICNVTYKSPTHNIDCYEIVFENGFKTIVDKDHRWLSKTEGERKHKVRTTEEMYNHMQTINRKRDSFYYAINTNKPLQLKEQDLIVPPYTFGAWLGDGTKDEGIITNHIKDNQIITEIEKEGFNTNRSGLDKNLRVYIYDLKFKLGLLGVLDNKHIPQNYIRGSYNQRLALLQGIMDTDGSIDKKGGCEIIWANKQMILELRELLFTLGIKSNIKEKQVQLKSWTEPRTYYRLWFKTNLPVFRLRRKLERIPNYPLRKTRYTRYIKKINPVKSIPTQCIQVDSPNHLFLATKEFIPTHNTTLTKAICSIFYQVGHQLVTKLTDKNQFGFSMFADSDVVVIDEIQSAPREFAEKIKNISSSDALPVEKKHYDTITVPAESVPRVFFIGNNFSKKLYEASDNAGVKRRILIIIPTQPIQDLGYQWRDLITDSSKQWLVQQATLEYIRQGLCGSNTPIKSISDNQKLDRIELCTFPEQYFIKQHFELSYLDNGSLDTAELLKYDDFHSFIRKCIDDAMVESTLKMGVPQTFIEHVKKCFGLGSNYNTTQKQGVVYFKAIVPKSEQAIKYLSK